MVTIGMNYKVLPDKGATFENACAGVIDAMAAMAGHTETHLFRDVSDASSYLIVSDWNSEEEFNTFIRSEKFASVTNWGKEQILAGRPAHTVYRR